jgi:hypothetical protein
MKLFFSVITMVILSNTHMFSQTQMELTRQSAESTKKAVKN